MLSKYIFNFPKNIFIAKITQENIYNKVLRLTHKHAIVIPIVSTKFLLINFHTKYKNLI